MTLRLSDPKTLYRTGLIEKWGGGTLEMARNCGKAGLPAPTFKEAQGALWVNFPRGAAAEEKVLEKVLEKVTVNQGKIVSSSPKPADN